jgi:hypothetical protein
VDAPADTAAAQESVTPARSKPLLFNALAYILLRKENDYGHRTSRIYAADLTIAIEDAFAAIRPDECRDYLTAAGYDAYDPT